MRRFLALLVTGSIAVGGTTGCDSGRPLPPPDISEIGAPPGTPPTGARRPSTVTPPPTRPPSATAGPPVTGTRAAPRTAARRPDVWFEARFGCRAELADKGEGAPLTLWIWYDFEVSADDEVFSFDLETTDLNGRTELTTHRRITHPPIGPGLSFELVTEVSANPLGRTAQMRFVVDPRNRIAERDERNNTLTVAFTLPREIPESGDPVVRCAIR